MKCWKLADPDSSYKLYIIVTSGMNSPSRGSPSSRPHPLEHLLIDDLPKPASRLQAEGGPNFGSLNPYKLDDLIDLSADGFNQNRVTRLAFLSHNSLHLEEEAVALLEQYAKSDVGFIGVWGKEGSGKGVLLDRALNLCEWAGSHFASAEKSKREKGISVWSTPLSRGRMKIFLLKMDGCYHHAQEDQDSYLLVSLMVTLCSSVLLVCSNQEDSSRQLERLAGFLKRAKSMGKYKEPEYGSMYWPLQVYCFLRRMPSSIPPLLTQLFQEVYLTVGGDIQAGRSQITPQFLHRTPLTNFNSKRSPLSSNCIRSVSSLVRHAHTRATLKGLSSLKFTGANLCKLLVNAVQQLNIKGRLSLDKLYHKSMKELYIDAYNFHTQVYVESLAEHIHSEQPYSMDYLLSAFADSSHKITNSFDQLNVDPQMKAQYSEKLEKYMTEKEKVVLAINKKKSAVQAKQSIPPIGSAKDLNKIMNYVKQVKRSPNSNDQVYVQELVPQLMTGIKKIQSEKKQDQAVMGKLEEVENARRQKVEELQILQTQVRETAGNQQKIKLQQTQYAKEEQKLQSRIKGLKMELKQRKKMRESKGVMRAPQELVEEQQKLEKQLRDKEEVLHSLKSLPEVVRSLTRIEQLHSQIEDRVHKQKELESVLASNIPRLQSIQTIKSKTSGISSARKVQSRVMGGQSPRIRVIPSPKNT